KARVAADPAPHGFPLHDREPAGSSLGIEDEDFVAADAVYQLNAGRAVDVQAEAVGGGDVQPGAAGAAPAYDHPPRVARDVDAVGRGQPVADLAADALVHLGAREQRVRIASRELVLAAADDVQAHVGGHEVAIAGDLLGEDQGVTRIRILDGAAAEPGEQEG